jgi:hypothetical protein
MVNITMRKETKSVPRNVSENEEEAEEGRRGDHPETKVGERPE